MINTKVKLHGTISSKNGMTGKLNSGIEKIYPPLENLEIAPSGEKQEFNHPNYYGYDNVTVEAIKLQEKTVIPTTNQQIITADDSFSGLNQVIVNKVTNEIDSNIKAENIKVGINILGVDGALEPDKPNQSKEVTPTKETQIIKADDGYELEQVTVNAISDEYVIPTGTLEITENGIHDVTNYKEVSANIHEPTPYSPKFISFYNYKGRDLDYEISNLDTSNMTTMESLFDGGNGNIVPINKIDVSHFNTSKVTNMFSMFKYQTGELIGIDKLDTSKVTNMSYMFYQSSVKNEDVRNFITDNVTNMSYMFNSYKREVLDLEHFNTSKVTDLSNIFSSANSLKTLKVNTWDTSKVRNFSYVFDGCSSLEDLDISNWEDGGSTSYFSIYMFRGCKKLTNLKFMKNVGKSFTSSTSANNMWKSFDFTGSPLLTKESAMSIINNLYDLTLNNAPQQYVKFHKNTRALLIDEEIAIATMKNWNITSN